MRVNEDGERPSWKMFALCPIYRVWKMLKIVQWERGSVLTESLFVFAMHEGGRRRRRVRRPIESRDSSRERHIQRMNRPRSKDSIALRPSAYGPHIERDSTDEKNRRGILRAWIGEKNRCEKCLVSEILFQLVLNSGNGTGEGWHPVPFPHFSRP